MMRRSNPWTAGLCLMACCLTVAAGCSRGVHRAEVTGTVTLAGKPVTQGVQVVFTPQAPDGEATVGVTNDRGRYMMYHKPGMKGLLAGTYTVSIKQPGDDSPGPGLILPPELAAIKIPERYRTGSSTLECVVGRTPTTFDIDIHGD
jgi:hypothetical protein